MPIGDLRVIQRWVFCLRARRCLVAHAMLGLTDTAHTQHTQSTRNNCSVGRPQVSLVFLPSSTCFFFFLLSLAILDAHLAGERKSEFVCLWVQQKGAWSRNFIVIVRTTLTTTRTSKRRRKKLAAADDELKVKQKKMSSKRERKCRIRMRTRSSKLVQLLAGDFEARADF